VLRGAGKTGRLAKSRGAACEPFGHHPITFVNSLGPVLSARIPSVHWFDRRPVCLRQHPCDLRADSTGDACAELIRASLGMKAKPMVAPRAGRIACIACTQISPGLACACPGLRVSTQQSLFLVGAVAAQTLVALFHQVRQRHRFQLVELVEQYGLQANRHRLWIAMGTT